MTENHIIGFMQGRLSPIVDGLIQSFPWTCWQQEFAHGEASGLHVMEWTLDQDRLYENPLMTPAGQAEIRELCQRHQFSVSSLTGDCFMQSPFWKVAGDDRQTLQDDFRAIATACHAVGVSMIVVPLVDNGNLESREQEDILVSYLIDQHDFLVSHNLQIIFECDYEPNELARFIGRLPAPTFGINYDVGNSAALGFDPAAEFRAYGERIINVHIKDRVLGGTTVPLGTGNADFETVFAELAKQKYSGKFILQTARAEDESHAEVLCAYRDMVQNWRAA